MKTAMVLTGGALLAVAVVLLFFLLQTQKIGGPPAY
jgi:hypothetical protein